MSKRETVYEQLRHEILRGDLRPGDVINERSVAESFGSSRVPLREALIELQRDGLITVIPRRGAFVRTFSGRDVQHLYELREALEGLAAARAALVAPRGAMTPVMQRLRSVLRSKKTDAKEAELAGVAFHDLVFEQCRNPLVGETAARIRDQVQLARRSSYDYSSDEWMRRGVEEHLHIAEAIADRDSAEAERLMKAHISAWSRHFRDELSSVEVSTRLLGPAG
jgi:DNA-binding GntR family transcriptional regulator